MTAGVASGIEPRDRGDERQARQERRDAVVQAARAHSEAVARHLDRLARYSRSAAPAPGVNGPRPLPRLAELPALLLADASPGALLRAALHVAGSAIDGADGVSVTVQRAGQVETAAASHPQVAEVDRTQYELREGPCIQAFEAGTPVVAAALPDRRWPAFGAHAHALGWGGVLAVPLSTREGRLGALNIYSRRPGVLGPGSLAVAQALADQVAVALTNANDFRRQQEVAATLQRTLLPPALPRIPGLAATAVYRPATIGINVGGDWYDLLPLGDGRVALVVGDVGGHGLEAATTMGQLRTAVRAYALEGHPPARVLELVDAFLQDADDQGYATCLYLVLDPRTGAVEWCNAGHPGPLLVAAVEPAPPDHERLQTHLAEAGRVAALGVPLPAGARSDVGSAVLPPGSRMLLFTDGLVERRGEALDEGLARLAADAVRSTVRPLELWCEDVVAAQLRGREVDDDVAVLAVELLAAPAAGAGNARHPKVDA
jgi:serine phosphatase RsbU (regulator of sigma subunit)